MSLQVWLPLDGNLNNNGLSNLKFSAPSIAAVDTAGKIGSCYKSSTSGGWRSDNKVYLGTKQSMCCWVKFTTLNTSSVVIGICGQHNYQALRGMGLNIIPVSSTTGRIAVSATNGSGRTYKDYKSDTLLSAGNWYHICYTYDGDTGECKIYINGELDKTFSYPNQAVREDYMILFAWSLTSSDTIHDTTAYHFIGGSINDFRAYDHCLSPREVKEISKGLVLHYKMDDIDGTVLRDCSGYGHNGTTSNVTLSTTAKKYNKSASFNGSSSFATVDNKACKLTDTISIALWVYSTVWASKQQVIISCTEAGGWDFEFTSNGSYKPKFNVWDGSTYQPATHNTTLASGWHHFVGTWDGFTTRLYIDGVISSSSSAKSTKTPIVYNANNTIFIGAEAYNNTTTPQSGYYVSGLISDVRIYAGVLDATDVLELYSTRASVCNNGSFMSGEFDELDIQAGVNANFITRGDAVKENYVITERDVTWTNNNISSTGTITVHNNKLSCPIYVGGHQYFEFVNKAPSTYYCLGASCNADGTIINKTGAFGSVAAGGATGVVSVGDYEWIRLLWWDQPATVPPFELRLWNGGSVGQASISKNVNTVNATSLIEV